MHPACFFPNSCYGILCYWRYLKMRSFVSVLPLNSKDDNHSQENGVAILKQKISEVQGEDACFAFLLPGGDFTQNVREQTPCLHLSWLIHNGSQLHLFF